MTKSDCTETALKIPLTVEENSTTSLDLTVEKLMAENVAKLHGPQVFVEQTPKIKAVRAKKTRPRRSALCRATQKLYSMETVNEPEKSLHIELNLYQMETC